MTNNSIKDSWNEYSDDYYNRIYNINDDIAYLKSDPWWAFPSPVRAMFREALPGLHGKRVLVPSSGDNGAVFAFYLLGAKVTSADISERQLENGKHIADGEGWDIEFICADSMTLEGVDDSQYDLVYTSNGVHVWICDLQSMYRNFNRVLKPNGRYIMFDTHPFNRPFDDSGSVIKVVKDYDETRENHWRVMDLYNAIVSQGFEVECMEEFHAEAGSHDLWFYKTLAEAEADGNKKYDMKQNPWAALPAWIGFSALKK